MTRITSTILVMMLLLNGTAVIMDASGLTEDLGVELATGVDDKMDSVVTEMRKGFSPNINIIQSFVSMAVAGLRVFGVIVSGVYAAPTLVINLLGGGEFVTVFVGVIAAPMYVIATLEMVYLAVGRDLV